MSNTQVGGVYQQIILDVIESSRVDFEEGGVDESVLTQLREGWQGKLSALQVATFPWDPKPEPPPIANPPTVPSNAGNYQSMGSPPLNPPQNGLPLQSMQQGNNNMNGGNMNGAPRIKTEPGLESPMMQNPQHQQTAQYGPPLNLPHNATTAQQRAAQHLHQNYGARATASINAIQGAQGQVQHQNGQQPSMQQMHQMQQAQYMQHQHQQQQQQRAAQGQGQGQGMTQGQNMPQRPQPTQEQYARMMAQNTAAQQQRLQQQQSQSVANGQNGVGGAQTDGAGDDFVISQVGPNGNEIMGRVEIDGLIRNQIENMGRRMEGGGLMLPLHLASTPSTRAQKVAKKSKSGNAQTDGGDDGDSPVKDEVDEDAINSDLDDPDDGQGDDEDDEDGLGHIMLCMYDKVQRVKNKWKCVMKDGVLTINGKEYVFHKATGEYEW